MNMLNIACGSRINDNFINIDFSPIDKRVRKVNLLKKLPFANESFEVAYSSHFLEHLSVKNAYLLLLEINRILKPKGILRLVVPDLENITKAYLNALSNVALITDFNRGGEQQKYINQYDFILLEMFDQMIRICSGGDLQRCFNNVKAMQNTDFARFIKERVGEDVLCCDEIKTSLKQKITFSKISNKILRLYLKAISLLIPATLRDEIFIRTSIGERHKWAYDRFSLYRLLTQCGFVSIKQQTFNTSQIPHFNTYLLDINADGTPYKGNSSLYMESIKP